MQLYFDESSIDEARDTSLDEFMFRNWYLLAPNESSKMFPVNRATQEVITSLPKNSEGSSSPAPVPLGEFIKTHFHRGAYLNSQTSYDVQSLVKPIEPLAMLPDLLHSCDGSVDSSSDQGFRFSVRRSKEEEIPKSRKRAAQVVEKWLEGGSKRRRADIQPTKFRRK